MYAVGDTYGTGRVFLRRMGAVAIMIWAVELSISPHRTPSRRTAQGNHTPRISFPSFRRRCNIIIFISLRRVINYLMRHDIGSFLPPAEIL